MSLKRGKVFKQQARDCSKIYAAVVVMAFDEQGQAETKDEKGNICLRAYRILTDELNFPAEDIIFDPIYLLWQQVSRSTTIMLFIS